MNEVFLLQAKSLREYCQTLFEKAGMAGEEAHVNADNLVDADLKGIDSHGASRMPIHLKRIKSGAVRANCEIKIISDRASAAVMDACHSMGPFVAKQAMDLAIQKAKVTGVAFVTVKNSNHYGTAGYYVEQAIREGMIGFSATNGSPRMAPWGGRDPFFGTNPFAVGIPADKQLPIIADMATSLVARGKIVIAAKQKEPIPLGWAINRDGEDTTNADEALVGTVLPFAGAKGSAIALIIDVLSGVLSGSVFGPHINDMYADYDKPTLTSHVFGAINIEAFTSLSQFVADIDRMILEIKQNTPAKNVAQIYLPGEIEQKRREQYLQQGIPFTKPIIEDLRKEGEAAGVAFTL